MNEPTFSVCSLLRERPEIVARFVRHYLGLGAEHVFVYWDGGPEDQDRATIAALEKPGRVTITFCDPGFWRSSDPDDRAVTLESLQRAAYHDAHSRCSTDWMLFCDADEFLTGPGPVAALLAEVPGEVAALRVRNLEAVWGPEDSFGTPFGCSHFRAPLPPSTTGRVAERLLLGRLAPLARRGMIGHSDGKHFLRRGFAGGEIGSHATRVGRKRIGIWADDLGGEPARYFFAHFDAIDYPRWAEKWRRRISRERVAEKMAKPRQTQQELIAEAFRTEAAERLFRRLYGLSPVHARVLSAMGCLERAQIFDRRDM